MIPDFLIKYPHITDELQDCYFHKIKIGDYSIHIQEDKENEYHFVSIWNKNVSIFAGWSEDINKIHKDIKKFLGSIE
jgi:hypothetical protein